MSGGDPFVGSDGPLASPGQQDVTTLVMGELQKGKDTEGRSGVREGVRAFSHESVTAEEPAGPEMRLHALAQKIAGKGGHVQEENGAARAANAVGDVHGLFHARLAIGACGSPEVGSVGPGLTGGAT